MDEWSVKDLRACQTLMVKVFGVVNVFRVVWVIGWRESGSCHFLMGEYTNPAVRTPKQTVTVEEWRMVGVWDDRLGGGSLGRRG